MRINLDKAILAGGPIGVKDSLFAWKTIQLS